MNILITGASGFIGQNLVNYFIKEGIHNIITLDLKPLNMLNICYSVTEGNGEKKYYAGKKGLKEIVKYEEIPSKTRKNYEYIIDEPVFDYKNIGKYSSKIKSIVDSFNPITM